MGQSKVTVQDVQPFIEHLESKDSRKRTIETYGSALRVFFGSYDEFDVDAIRSHLKRYKTPDSKRTILAAMRTFAKFYEVQIPWEKIALPRKQKRLPRVLKNNEQERVHRWIKARDPHYADVFLFMAHTALRSAEVRNLSQGDLKTDNSGARYIVIRDPKNHEDRAVPLDSVASRIIGETGLPMKYRRQKLTDLIKQAREALEIERFTPHNLRKTCLTRLHQKGADVVSLARFAGHRDVNSLMDYLGSSVEEIRSGVFRDVPN